MKITKPFMYLFLLIAFQLNAQHQATHGQFMGKDQEKRPEVEIPDSFQYAGINNVLKSSVLRSVNKYLLDSMLPVFTYHLKIQLITLDNKVYNQRILLAF